MNHKLVFITALLFGSHAAAQESCALRAAKLLASGNSKELATWFTKSDATVAEQLYAMATQIGALTNLVEAKQGLSGLTTRRSVVPAAQPSAYSFIGTWASANSERLGVVRIQASSESSSACKLLALHVDTQQK